MPVWRRRRRAQFRQLGQVSQAGTEDGDVPQGKGAQRGQCLKMTQAVVGDVKATFQRQVLQRQGGQSGQVVVTQRCVFDRQGRQFGKGTQQTQAGCIQERAAQFQGRQFPKRFELLQPGRVDLRTASQVQRLQSRGAGHVCQPLVGEQVFDQDQIGQLRKVADALQGVIGQANRTLHVQRFQIGQGGQLPETAVAELAVSHSQLAQVAELQQLRHVRIADLAAGQTQLRQRSKRRELAHVEPLGRSPIAGEINGDGHAGRIEFDFAAQFPDVPNRCQRRLIHHRGRFGCRGRRWSLGRRSGWRRRRSVRRTAGGEQGTEDTRNKAAGVA